MLPSNSTPRYLAKRNDCLCLPKTYIRMFVAVLFMMKKAVNNANGHLLQNDVVAVAVMALICSCRCIVLEHSDSRLAMESAWAHMII